MHRPGVNHIILTVSDPRRSQAFYGNLLGFEVIPLEEDPTGGFYFDAGGGVFFFIFNSRQPALSDRFSEFRIGLDHIAFNAASEDELRAIADKLIKAGVDTKGVETFAPTGNLYVSFRDPDNIQLEYWLP